MYDIALMLEQAGIEYNIYVLKQHSMFDATCEEMKGHIRNIHFQVVNKTSSEAAVMWNNRKFTLAAQTYNL